MTFTSWTFTLLKSLKSRGKEAYKETIITQHDNCFDGWIQKAWEEQKEDTFPMKEKHLELLASA